MGTDQNMGLNLNADTKSSLIKLNKAREIPHPGQGILNSSLKKQPTFKKYITKATAITAPSVINFSIGFFIFI